MKKRLLAMVLTVVMLLSAMPTVAFAAEAEVCEHKYEETIIKPAADCTQTAIVKLHCTKCNETKYVSRIGHVWDEGKVTTDAICGKEGVKTYTCSVCGATKTEKIPATGKHQWGEETVVKKADCENNAMVGVECAICGETKGLTEVPGTMTDHEGEFQPALEPTCDKSGHNEGVICKNCGKALLGAEEIPATGKHVEKKIEGEKATCSKPGKTDGVECEDCGKVLVKQQVIPVDKNAHAWPKEANEVLKPADCTATGIGKFACSECGTSKYASIPAAHTWSVAAEGKVEPDCEKAGKEIRVCAKCQATETRVLPATGHKWDEGKVTTEATCVKEGEMTYTCVNGCGKTKTEKIPATGEHTWTDGTIPATCTENAKQGKFCEVCHKANGELTELPGTALGHKEEHVEAKPATCVEDGNTEGLWCPVCKTMVLGEVIPATGVHTEKKIEGKKATCQATGLTEGAYCEVCGKTLVEQKEIPADANAHTEEFVAMGTPVNPCTQANVGKYVCKDCKKTLRYAQVVIGHVWDEENPEIVVPADCEKDGEMIFTCTACTAKKTEVIKAEGHKWDKGVVTTEPTCAKAGVKTFTCENCGKTRTEEVAATGKHEFVQGETPATCTSNKKVGLVCSVCGATKGEMTEVPGTMKDHNYQPENEVPATCYKAGRKAGIWCTECHDVMDGMEVIPATGKHVEEVIKGYKADCKNTGLSDGKRCTVPGCGAITVKQEVLPIDPNNHHDAGAVTVLKPATCTSTGISSIKCSYCGVNKYVFTPVGEHVFADELVDIVNPTCTEDGTGVRTCTICGKKEVVTIEATGHDWIADEDGVKTCSVCGETLTSEICTHNKTVVIPGKDATCTESGLTEGKKCTICNEIIVKQEEIPAGHKEEVVPGKPATCKETGLTDGVKCSVCGEILLAQEEIPFAAHTEEVIPGKAATCQETGLTDGVKCSVCGEILMEQEEIPVGAHTEEIIPGKAATCQETGLTDGVKCSVCGEILMAQEEIPVGAHTEEIIPGKPATCLVTGLTDGVRCSVCGEILMAQEETPLAPHTEEVIPGKPATATEDGLTEGKKCSVCGTVLVAQQVIPATGEPSCNHSYVYAGSVLDENGVAHIVFKCSLCGTEK